MGAWAIVLCMAVQAEGTTAGSADQAMATCYEVAAAADRAGVPMELAVALAYTESRMSPTAESSAGAVGPLQVVPWWHCPGRRARGCDLVDTGIAVLLRYGRLYGPGWPKALCHWNSGNVCVRRARAFARIVIDRADLFRHSAMLLEDVWQR